MGSYFDAANRLTDSVNVGTNGGVAWVRPSTVPGGSDTVLVTHSDYNAAGWVLDTIDPRGIKSGTFYDLLGRTIETVGAWDGTQSPTPTNSANQITDSTYDGNGDVLTLTAVQPTGGSTPNQTTGYVYGIGTTIGSDLFSKDLIGTVQYPDPSTGQPGTGFGSQESFGYNWQGQKTSYAMRDATTHQYLYDVLARLTADYVSSSGGNVDRTIQRLGYSFNDAGLPFQQTSYSDAAGTTVANQLAPGISYELFDTSHAMSDINPAAGDAPDILRSKLDPGERVLGTGSRAKGSCGGSVIGSFFHSAWFEGSSSFTGRYPFSPRRACSRSTTLCF